MSQVAAEAFPCTVMVFKHTFEGVDYIVAVQAAGLAIVAIPEEHKVMASAVDDSPGGVGALAVLNAAITRANAFQGGEVYVAPGQGNYWVNGPIQMRDDVYLRGTGNGTKIILSDGSNTHVIVNQDPVGGNTRFKIGFMFVDANRFNQGVDPNYGNPIHLKNVVDCSILHVWCQGGYDGGTVATGGHGIYLQLAIQCIVEACHLEGNEYSGIDLRNGCYYNTIVACTTLSNGAHGIQIDRTGDAVAECRYNTVCACTSHDDLSFGIGADDGPDNSFVGNTVYSCTVGIGLIFPNAATCDCVVADNIIYGNAQAGIEIRGANCKNAIVVNNTVKGNTRQGIYLWNGASDATIAFNTCDGNGYDQIQVVTNISNFSLIGNRCLNAPANYSGISINDNCDNGYLLGNTCRGNARYGIEIESADCGGNRIGDNKLRGNTIGCILDSGTNTELPSIQIIPDFASAGYAAMVQVHGFLVDAVGEYCTGWAVLPKHLQEIVRIKIWARSVVAEADAMRLNPTVQGGAAGESDATHAYNIVDLPSSTTNFGVGAVIVWTVPFSSVPLLAAGDCLRISANYEDAGGADIATNANIRVFEIEYV